MSSSRPRYPSLPPPSVNKKMKWILVDQIKIPAAPPLWNSAASNEVFANPFLLTYGGWKMFFFKAKYIYKQQQPQK